MFPFISIGPFAFAVSNSGAGVWWVVAIFAGFFWNDISREVFEKMKTNDEEGS
jgi:hypothetical protein